MGVSSDDDRATRASHQARGVPLGLGHSAGIPNAEDLHAMLTEVLREWNIDGEIRPVTLIRAGRALRGEPTQ